jgi:hypothetical protein
VAQAHLHTQLGDFALFAAALVVLAGTSTEDKE